MPRWGIGNSLCCQSQGLYNGGKIGKSKGEAQKNDDWSIGKVAYFCNNIKSREEASSNRKKNINNKNT